MESIDVWYDILLWPHISSMSGDVKSWIEFFSHSRYPLSSELKLGIIAVTDAMEEVPNVEGTPHIDTLSEKLYLLLNDADLYAVLATDYSDVVESAIENFSTDLNIFEDKKQAFIDGETAALHWHLVLAKCWSFVNLS